MGDCTNIKDELTKITQTLEGEFGYLLHAVAEFSNRYEMLEDPVFQMIMSRWSFVRVREEDEDSILKTVLPAVEKTANRVTLAWEEEADALMRPYLESKPDLHQDIGHLAKALAIKGVLEHLRLRVARQKQLQ